MLRRIPFLFVALFLLGNSLHAHPVPLDNHDRTIVVRLDWDAKAKEVVVLVKYRLEVGEDTVLSDLKPFREELNFRLQGLKFYSQCTDFYARIFARNLSAKANGKALTF